MYIEHFTFTFFFISLQLQSPFIVNIYYITSLTSVPLLKSLLDIMKWHNILSGKQLSQHLLPTNPCGPTSFKAILSAKMEEFPWAMLAKGPACTNTGVP